MYRKAFEELKQWKSRRNRKPMLIRGARQVGKTWLMKEFGREEYRNTAYLSFADKPQAAQIFAADYDTEDIIQSISLLTNEEIIPGETLVILDEIQDCERAIHSLKYLKENSPEHHIMAAGSLLGVAMRHRRQSFPVGQVDMITLHPLTFDEFLQAMGEQQLLNVLNRHQPKLLQLAHERLIIKLKEYMYTGGMPEVVKSFAEERDFREARRLQQQIISGYENDFSKYAETKDVPRIHAVWASLPQQLARENRKFVYKYLGEGARAREYEMAVEWLIICGLLHKVHRISKPGIPLTAYEQPNAFKLYAPDCGLLGALSRLDARSLVAGNSVFEEFKGALTEQFVLQELRANNMAASYWEADGGTAEVDFVVQLDNSLIPIEVKAGINLRARSLASYRQRYQPAYAIRTSLAPFEQNDSLFNIPLYAFSHSEELIHSAGQAGPPGR